jgi:hypothetical protein
VTDKSEATFAEEKAVPEKVMEERSSSNGSAFMIKPNQSIKEETFAAGGMEGSAVEDFPMNEEPAAEVPMHQIPVMGIPAPAQSGTKTTYNTVPPAPIQASAHIDPSIVTPEVRNVLAVLEAMRQHQSPHQI